jgi:hypothetical protein
VIPLTGGVCMDVMSNCQMPASHRLSEWRVQVTEACQDLTHIGLMMRQVATREAGGRSSSRSYLDTVVSNIMGGLRG